MALLSSDLTKIYLPTETDLPQIGEIYDAPQGAKYMFLPGVAATVVGDVVTFNGVTYSTTRLVANAQGRVAIAMAATVASTFGWYQVAGLATARAGTVLTNKPAYVGGTGLIDDLVVAGNLIANMFTASADGVPSAGLCRVTMNYPFVTNSIS